MCKQYEYQQMQCGQCYGHYGPKLYEDLQYACQWARPRGGFGHCPRPTQKAKVRRIGWRDCPNCAQREKVHAMWTGGAASATTAGAVV